MYIYIYNILVCFSFRAVVFSHDDKRKVQVFFGVKRIHLGSSECGYHHCQTVAQSQCRIVYHDVTIAPNMVCM